MVVINIYLIIILLWCLQMLTLLVVVPPMKDNAINKTVEVIHKIKSSKQDTGVEYISPREEYERDLYE